MPSFAVFAAATLRARYDRGAATDLVAGTPSRRAALTQAGTRTRRAPGTISNRSASFRPARRRARSAAARPRRPRTARRAGPRPSGGGRACRGRSSARSCRKSTLRRRRRSGATSKQAVVGLARPARASSRRRASGRSRRRRRASGPSRSSPSSVTVTSVFFQLEEDAHQRVEERRLAAERLRRLVRALGDGAAHPDRADVREPALAVRRRPRCGSWTRPASIVRVAPSSATSTASSNLRRDPVGAAEVLAGAARDHGELDVAAPGDPVRRPRSASRRRRRRRAAAPPSRPPARASSIRWPGRSEKSVSPARPSARRAVRELRPAPCRRRRSPTPG